MSYNHSCRTTPPLARPCHDVGEGQGMCVFVQCWDTKGGGACDRIKQPGMWGGEREEELIREVLVQKGCVSARKKIVANSVSSV